MFSSVGPSQQPSSSSSSSSSAASGRSFGPPPLKKTAAFDFSAFGTSFATQGKKIPVSAPSPVVGTPPVFDPERLNTLLGEIIREVDEYKREYVVRAGLEDLKPQADIIKHRLEETLTIFMKKRKAGARPSFDLLKQTLIEHGELEAVHAQIDLELGRLFVRVVLKYFGNKYVVGTTAAVTVALTGYTIISLGIAPFEDEMTAKALVISGVICVILGVIGTLTTGYLEQLINKYKITEEDLIKSEFYRGYFHYLTSPIEIEPGKKRMDFDGCVTFINIFDKKKVKHIPLEVREALKQFAEDCKVFQDNPYVIDAAGRLRSASEVEYEESLHSSITNAHTHLEANRKVMIRSIGLRKETKKFRKPTRVRTRQAHLVASSSSSSSHPQPPPLTTNNPVELVSVVVEK